MSRIMFSALYFGSAFAITFSLSGNYTAAIAAGIIQPALYAVVSFHERLWHLVDQAGIPDPAH